MNRESTVTTENQHNLGLSLKWQCAQDRSRWYQVAKIALLCEGRAIVWWWWCCKLCNWKSGQTCCEPQLMYSGVVAAAYSSTSCCRTSRDASNSSRFSLNIATFLNWSRKASRFRSLSYWLRQRSNSYKESSTIDINNSFYVSSNSLHFSSPLK